jgi:hypothetical protein
MTVGFSSEAPESNTEGAVASKTANADEQTKQRYGVFMSDFLYFQEFRIPCATEVLIRHPITAPFLTI